MTAPARVLRAFPSRVVHSTAQHVAAFPGSEKAWCRESMTLNLDAEPLCPVKGEPDTYAGVCRRCLSGWGFL